MLLYSFLCSSFNSHYLIVKIFLSKKFTYFFDRWSDRKGRRKGNRKRERKRERSQAHFQKSRSRNSILVSMWVAGVLVLESSFTPFPGALTGTWIRSRAGAIRTGTQISQAGVAHDRLTVYSPVIIAPRISLNVR